MFTTDPVNAIVTEDLDKDGTDPAAAQAAELVTKDHTEILTKDHLQMAQLLADLREGRLCLASHIGKTRGEALLHNSIS